MTRRLSPFLALALVASGCATHRLVVAEPNPTDDQPAVVTSSAIGWGAAQRRTVAECDTNLLDEVRVHQNFGEALATVLTLGLWTPVRIEYRCAKVPSEEAVIGEIGPEQPEE